MVYPLFQNIYKIDDICESNNSIDVYLELLIYPENRTIELVEINLDNYWTWACDKLKNLVANWPSQTDIAPELGDRFLTRDEYLLTLDFFKKDVVEFINENKLTRIKCQ